MKGGLLNHFLAKMIVIVALSGCSSVPKSLQERTLDDMYPILTDEQCQALNSCNSGGEINKFLGEFWHSIDSTSGTNEYQTEYLRRLEYANEHFPDRQGWGRSDRKRIYLVYGPPYTIERQECVNYALGTFSTIKSLEIWLYLTPGNDHALPSRGDDIYRGEKKFIFGDMTGAGFYKILYSSEDNGDIDARMFHQN